MGTVISADGTRIDFDRAGSGPPVVLLSAGPNDRSVSQPLVELLKPFLTVYTYDHRARGRSGDTLPHSPDREFEDLAAVIAEAGGVAGVFGSSGGGNIALDAADYMPISKVAMWEPPYIVEGARSAVPPEWGLTVQEAIDAGRPEDGISYWLTDIVEIPAEYVAQMKGTPFWEGMVANAQGLVYDASVLWDFSVPGITTEMPVLVIDGGQATLPWIRTGIDALLKVLPVGRHEVLEGQPHDVAPDVIAPVLIKFFGE